MAGRADEDSAAAPPPARAVAVKAAGSDRTQSGRTQSDRAESVQLVAGPQGSLRAAAVRDPRAAEYGIPADLLAEVYGHARETYPEECCGLLLGHSTRALTRVVRCTNVQAARRARGESELDARHAFWIDERQLLRALREAEARAEVLAVIYHSHVDADAYFSYADAAGALGPSGSPLYPGTVQLVVSVREGRVRDAVGFAWDAATGRFVGRPIAQVR